MSKPNNNTISLISIQTCEPDEVHAMFSSPAKLAVKSAQIATEKLSENLSGFIRALSAQVEKLPSSCGSHDVDELAFSLSVDAAGKISLVGELSAGVTSGITVKFKKKTTR